MTVYSVYQPPVEADDADERAGSLVFVKEGFSWGALLLPGIWLLYRRLWIEFVVFLALLVLIGWLCGDSDAGKELFSWLSLGVVLLFAFEANDIRAAALERRGYRLAGVASGRSRDQAELDFFRGWLPGQRTTRRPTSTPPAIPARSNDGEGVIGLFPQA